MSPRPPAPPGTRAADRGYVRVKVGDHPRAAHGWVREHVLVMWGLLGPGPHPCAVCGHEVDWDDGLEIDHTNRRRRDNRPENLRVVCRVCNNRNRVIPPRGAAVSELAPVLLAELRADPAALDELRDLLAAGPSVYTPATLAAALGRTPRAIRAAIQRGELDAVKRGNGWVIGADAVARWAAGEPRTGGPKLQRPRTRTSGRGPMGRALRT